MKFHAKLRMKKSIRHQMQKCAEYNEILICRAKSEILGHVADLQIQGSRVRSRPGPIPSWRLIMTERLLMGRKESNQTNKKLACWLQR